jgi:hypothetical protein
MPQIRNIRKCLWLLLFLYPGFPALAQNGQFLPEVDAYYKLHDSVRVWFQAKETFEAGAPVTAEFGPSLDFYVRPIDKLLDITTYDNDDSKSRPAIFTIGYRYLPYPDSTPTNRLEPVLTLNAPTGRMKVLISDRNRFDLDWNNGVFTWRYRNRLQLQRTWRIRTYHISPYAMAEFFYESQYSKWAETALYAGCDFPIGHHFSLSPYYEHQNQTGKSPNQQYNQFGLILNIFYGRK